MYPLLAAWNCVRLVLLLGIRHDLVWFFHFLLLGRHDRSGSRIRILSVVRTDGNRQVPYFPPAHEYLSIICSSQ